MNRLLGYINGGWPHGILIFLNQKGTVIPLYGFWIVLNFFVFVAGGYFIVKYNLQKLNIQQIESIRGRLAEIEQPKRTGDKVRVTLDNAEVKSRSYRQKIINSGLPSHIEMPDALYDSNRNQTTREVEQTYIVFYKQYSGKTYKFVSQVTTQNADAVKRYMDRQKGIDLFIDPKNPTSYFFELPFV